MRELGTGERRVGGGGGEARGKQEMAPIGGDGAGEGGGDTRVQGGNATVDFGAAPELALPAPNSTTPQEKSRSMSSKMYVVPAVASPASLSSGPTSVADVPTDSDQAASPDSGNVDAGSEGEVEAEASDVEMHVEEPAADDDAAPALETIEEENLKEEDIEDGEMREEVYEGEIDLELEITPATPASAEASSSERSTLEVQAALLGDKTGPKDENAEMDDSEHDTIHDDQSDAGRASFHFFSLGFFLR